jgi:hypothetical protein
MRSTPSIPSKKGLEQAFQVINATVGHQALLMNRRTLVQVWARLCRYSKRVVRQRCAFIRDQWDARICSIGGGQRHGLMLNGGTSYLIPWYRARLAGYLSAADNSQDGTLAITILHFPCAGVVVRRPKTLQHEVDCGASNWAHVPCLR